MACSTSIANTVGAIAKRAGVDSHRVAYLIRARGIQPEFRAGIQRIFSEADTDFIVRELRRIEENRAAS